ncbi:hypothetical protein LEP1GSC071_2770 [Leptospira santarosai str. JET]|nr:hypothetical protein LEP1GSC071_2770 [Leptospira santarosai str. JET]
MEIYPSDVRFAIDVTEKISGMESVGVFDRIQKEALKLYECTIKIRTKKMDHADSRLGKSNEVIFDSFRRSFETGFF